MAGCLNRVRDRSLSASAACMLVGAGALANVGPVTLIPPDGSTTNDFGAAVDIDGDTMVIGQPIHEHLGAATGAGSAYVYRWSGSEWELEVELLPPDGAAFDRFGGSVAIDGATVVIGAAEHGAGGAAYVFTRTGTTWTQQSKLEPSDAAIDAEFGFSVDVHADTIVAGAPARDNGMTDGVGAAYVFVRNGQSWSEQEILLASDGAALDNFGYAVALEGDIAVVGADGDDESGAESGSAYVFTRQGATWLEASKLLASDGASTDRFGAAIDIDGAMVLIGAPEKEVAWTNVGRAYIFVPSGSSWVEDAVVEFPGTHPAIANEAHFGASVSIQDGVVIIGAPGSLGTGTVLSMRFDGAAWTLEHRMVVPSAAPDDQFGHALAYDAGTLVVTSNLADTINGVDSGAAYVIERVGDVWIGEDQQLLAADAASFDEFGRAVEIDGDYAIVGAPNENFKGAQAGAAYVFVRSGLSWSQQQKLTASDGAAGDGFGLAVAISGSTLIIGAPNDDNQNGADAGSVYVFTRVGGTWTEQVRVAATAGSAGALFGSAVSIDNGAFVVGAIAEGATGAAYVFEGEAASWSEQKKINPLTASSGAFLGLSVDIKGDALIVGAPSNDSPVINQAGGAYIYERIGQNWVNSAWIVADDAGPGEGFGFAVAIDGDDAMISAPQSTEDGKTAAGMLYTVRRGGGGWPSIALPVIAGEVEVDLIGRSIAMDGGSAIVGARGGDGNPGRAILLRRFGETWRPAHELLPAIGVPGDNFGESVDIDNGQVIVGQEGFDGSAGVNQGGAWIYPMHDAALNPLALNAYSGAEHLNLADAVDAAAAGHTVVALGSSFSDLTPTDYLAKPLSVRSTSDLHQAYLNAITLANGASLSAATGESMEIYGLIDVPAGASASIRGWPLRLGAGADINIFSNANLSVQAPTATLEGDVTAFPGAGASFNGDVSLEGDMTLLGGSLGAATFKVARGGRFIGAGTLATPIDNYAAFTTIDDTLITDDLTNRAGGVVTVQIGTLTLLGDLTNDGAIIGDVQSLARSVQTQPGDGFSVSGDYRAGAGASLFMSSDLWRVSVTGDFDVAINDHARYDLAQASFRIGAAAPTDLERMSIDVGRNLIGLDRTIPGHFPIGTLRLTGAVTNLVDAHDNDGLGQSVCEAVYVRNLIIDAGATLNTNGCPIYYESLTNNGAVDNPSNLIQLSACAADLNGDDVVDGMDLALILAAWTTSNPLADLNADGTVDGMDLAGLLAAWGVCD